MMRKLITILVVVLALTQIGVSATPRRSGVGLGSPRQGKPDVVGVPAGGQLTDRPSQADGIVRLLLDLESAIGSGRVADFRAITSPAIPQNAVSRFEMAVRGGAGSRAIVRERTRRANGAAFDVIADVLVSKDDVGRIATWQITAAPGSVAGQYRIDDLHELAALDGLLKLSLDARRQFTVRNLVINATDLTFKMSSGTAFVAESPNGITGLVLRGKADVSFTPPDKAEQVQVRLFSGQTGFAADADTAFVRLNPAELPLRLSEQSLVPAPPDSAELLRAQQVFDDMIGRTYNIDLRSLTPERWSLEPSYGSFVLEFRTKKYGWLTYARSPSDHEDISLFDRDHQRNISLYASQDNLSKRGRSYSDDDGRAFDIEHQKLDLLFDPARLWVSGRASVQLRITAQSVGSISIRLAQPLAVTSVSSPTLGDLLSLRIVGQNTILVGFPDLVERGTLLTLDVVYGGRLEAQPLDREAIAPQGQAQRPTDPSDTTVIVTPEPRYLYSNRVPWYPQGASTDYSTAEMRFTVPSEYQLVASGSLIRSAVVTNQDQSRTGAKSLRVLDYVADRPVRYLACVISRFLPIGRSRVPVPAVSPPTLHLPGESNDSTNLNLDVVSTSRMTGRNRQTPQRVGAMLAAYARMIGESPYPDFTLAALDDNLPGGHSPAYFAVFHQPLPTTPYSWANDPVAFDDIYPHFFLAHEIAHQWWGQAVGWKNYHEQWLSEGLAQYFAALFAAQDKGPGTLEALIVAMRKGAEPYLDQGPISLGYRLGHVKSEGRVFRAIVYNKSAVVLHMLRRMMGDDAFFKGLRQFYTTWRFKKAGTDDFQAAMAVVSPMNLDRFFDRWIRGFNRPNIRVTWHNAAGESTIRLEQTGEVFDFPLTVLVQYEDGKTETRTLKVTDQTLEEKLTTTSPIRRVTIKDDMTLYEVAR